ncbi:hypothetical protein M7I_6771 [Glarea lozoyensis 74030]|uniref:Uncharacterized protein n=1 Tax=Glarea lozoyensis (strain ATCC 74030 / MF5533) TaxID=1104152 RepID=H0EVH3_GLAL7|nr:hypothetical protein M7I_6771 [Glarea lozoyensis 74030]
MVMRGSNEREKERGRGRETQYTFFNDEEVGGGGMAPIFVGDGAAPVFGGNGSGNGIPMVQEKKPARRPSKLVKKRFLSQDREGGKGKGREESVDSRGVGMGKEKGKGRWVGGGGGGVGGESKGREASVDSRGVGKWMRRGVDSWDELFFFSLTPQTEIASISHRKTPP